MRDRAKATAGSLAAQIRRATLRLERMVILRGELVGYGLRQEERERAQGDILGAAEALDRALERAYHWERKTGRRSPVIDQAIRGADAVDARAFPYYGDLL